MAALTIRNLDEATKQALRLRAARKSVSMEQEARNILRDAVLTGQQSDRPAKENFYDAVRHLVDKYESFDIDLPTREPMREPSAFE